MFSALVLTTAFVLILSLTELQQVTDLKGEKEALERKLTDFMREKSALEGEVGKLKEENEALVADVETLKKWSDDLHQVVKIVQRDFENWFEDIKNEKNLFEPGTSHTDNSDVSVLNYGLSIKIVNSQGIAIATFSPRQ